MQRARRRASRSRPATAPISPAPGRKTSRSPSVSACARRTTAATWSSSRGSTRRPCAGATGGAGGHHTGSTGCSAPRRLDDRHPAERGRRPARPARSPTWRAAAGPGAAPRGRRRRRPARGRCRGAARGTRRARRRRCPASSGSRCSRRTSTPVVTTSTRVCGPTVLSPRTVWPTDRPGRSPSSALIRRAAARAATRRGSATTTRPVDQRGERERDERRLAGAGRRDEHGRAASAQGRRQLGQCRRAPAGRRRERRPGAAPGQSRVRPAPLPSAVASRG